VDRSVPRHDPDRRRPHCRRRPPNKSEVIPTPPARSIRLRAAFPVLRPPGPADSSCNARPAAHGAGRAVMCDSQSRVPCTPALSAGSPRRGRSPSSAFPTSQHGADTSAGFEPTTNGSKPSLYPTELACGGNCPVPSRYTSSRLLRGESAPAGHWKPDRCEKSGQRPPDDASLARGIE
jgi:hypothetical protein